MFEVVAFIIQVIRAIGSSEQHIAVSTKKTRTKIEIPQSVSDYISKSIYIYPNPTSSLIEIIAPQTIIQKVIVRNLFGEVVLSKQQNKLNISHLPKGFYVIEVFTNSSKHIQKILIQ